MNILLPGQYPRSEKLIAAARDFDRNRISQRELQRSFEEDSLHFQELQNGLPTISTGMFQWQDLLRPFAELFDDSHTDSLIRFYETNTFWRKLSVQGNPKVKDTNLDDWIDKYFFDEKSFSKEDPLVFTLPFLYIFHDYSHGIPLQTIANVLEIVATKLLSFPNKTLCFFEPSFGWRTLSQEERHVGKSLIESIKKSANADIYLITSFFSIEHETETLFSFPADGIGIDFYVNPISCLKSFPKDKKILAGIINTGSTLLESDENITSFLTMLKHYIPDEKIVCTPNGPSELLPRIIMDKKVKNLKEILL